MLVWSSGINAVNSVLMKNRKSQVTNSDAQPSIALLALAVNNTGAMRIRKRFKVENEKVEGMNLTDPASGAISIEKDPFAKQVTEFCSWRGKKKRTKARKKHCDGKHDYEIEILVQDKMSRPKSIIKSPSSRPNRKSNMGSHEVAVQSEMKPAFAMVSLSGNATDGMNICSSPQLDGSCFVIGNGIVDMNSMTVHNKGDAFTNSLDLEIQRMSEARDVITYARRRKKDYGCKLVGGKNEGRIDNKPIMDVVETCFDKDKPADESEEIIGLSKRDYPNDIRTEKASEQGASVKDKPFNNECGRSYPEEHVDCQSSLLLSGSSGSRNDISQIEKDGNNFSIERVKVDKDIPIVDALEEIVGLFKCENPINVVTEKIREHEISVKDKAFNDECGKNSLEEPMAGQSSLLLSDSSCSRNATSQIEKDGNNLSLERAQVDRDMPIVDASEKSVGLCKSENPIDVVTEKVCEHEISVNDKAFDDECGKSSSEEHVDSQSSLLLSNSSKSRYDTLQVEKDGNNLSLERSLSPSSRRKLLVLDLNGLIAEIVRYVPERHTAPDVVISMKAVFKRPFYEDFMKFCFARFTVGIWSSRAKSNVDSIVDFLLGDAKQNLLFCWDQSQCTETGFYTVENRNKPLLVKKLQKLWEKSEPGLPWELGEFNESNTLLLDDSPYKALMNPPHTAIFPPTYEHTHKDDDSLGPGGSLRSYLEGLADAGDVQQYVKENPFGQRPITEKNASWRFYERVIEAILNTSGNARNKCSTNAIPHLGHQQEIIQGDIAPVECSESHEERACDSQSRHMSYGTDGRLQRNRVERREGYWNSNHSHERACVSPYRHTLCDTDSQHRSMEMQQRGVNWNSVQNQQRVIYSPNKHTLCDSDKQDWRTGGTERPGGKWKSDNNHKRGSYSPYRRAWHDSDRQDARSGARRQGGDWDSDCNRQRVSDYRDHHDIYRSGDTKLQECRRLIQIWGRIDCNQASKDLDKRPVSDDKEEPIDDSVRHSPCNKKGSSWSSWNRASQDRDKHHVSYEQIGHSSFNKKGSGWNSWNLASQERKKDPVSYHQIGHSSINMKDSGWNSWNLAAKEREKDPISHDQTGSHKKGSGWNSWNLASHQEGENESSSFDARLGHSEAVR